MQDSTRRVLFSKTSQNEALVNMVGQGNSLYYSNNKGRDWRNITSDSIVPYFKRAVFTEDYIYVTPYNSKVIAYKISKEDFIWEELKLEANDSLKYPLTSGGVIFENNGYIFVNRRLLNKFQAPLLFRLDPETGSGWEALSLDTAITNYFTFNNNIFAATEDQKLIKSTDNGDSWTIVTELNFYPNQFVKQGSKLIAGAGVKGVFSSIDTGKTWQLELDFRGVSSIVKYRDSFLINANIPSEINNVNRGLFFADAEFNSLERTEILTDEFLGLGVELANDTLFAVGADDFPIQYSADTGNTWHGYSRYLDSLRIELSEIAVQDSIIITLLHPTNYGRLFTSSDYGTTWNYLNTGIQYFLDDVFSDPFISGSKIFVKYDDRIRETYKVSNDFGKSLHNLEADFIDDSTQITTIRKLNNGDLLLLTMNKGIYKSTDNAETWTQIADSTNKINGKYLSKLKQKNGILYFIDIKNSLFISTDSGNSWVEKEEVNFEKNELLRDFLILDSYYITTSMQGIKVSSDKGKTWRTANSGLTETELNGYRIGKIHRIGNELLLNTNLGLYKTTLDKLGVVLDVEEKTEKRNYLYTFPPYPQPAKTSVQVKFYWDINLPMETEDISIYNLNGTKINTEGSLSLEKGAAHWGHLKWDCSAAPPGVYLIKIKHGTETRTAKVVVE